MPVRDGEVTDKMGVIPASEKAQHNKTRRHFPAPFNERGRIVPMVFVLRNMEEGSDLCCIFGWNVF